MRKVAALLATFGSLACDSPVAPLPEGAVSFEAPALYERWWSLTEQCSGLSGRLGRIQWFVVPGAETVPADDGEPVAGFFERSGRRIVLAGEYQMQGEVVRHEMLHALLNPIRGHPRQLFIGRCGGVVSCPQACVAEGGPASTPNPSAVSIMPAELEIGAFVEPTAPSSALYDGRFWMVVSATNTLSVPAVVTLPGATGGGLPLSYSYSIDGLGSVLTYNERAQHPEVARFGPHETKRFVFDFVNVVGATRYKVAPGTYTFRGAYGGRWASTEQTVVVSR